MESSKDRTNPSVAGIIKQHAAETPDKLALVVGEDKVTYADLYRRINSAAVFLKDHGVGPGVHVASVANYTLAYVVCEYAVLGLGGVHIPVENRVPGERLAEIARQVDASLVISPERPPCDADWLSAGEITSGTGFDETWEPAGVTDECSEIIFTTGTTGKSKGVMLSSHCLQVYMSVMNPGFGLEPDSVFLVTTPLNHVGGLHRIHQCLTVGCTAVLLDGIKNLKAFFGLIEEYGVTHTYLPPASIKMLLMLAKKPLAELNGKLEFIYTASAPFPTSDIEALIQLLPDTRLHQGYGSSETGSICNCQYNAPGKSVNSLGKPYPVVEVKLLDEEGNEVHGANKEGKICSRSGMNMLGYYNEPELTASVLKDGFIYSKDLMYFDEEGELHFAGRSDDVININGFKVAPTEVEDVALRLPFVADCACLPFDGVMGRSIRMFVVMEDGHAFNAQEITGALERQLEAYKIPKEIVCLDEIPRTFNGKLDRKKLIAMDGQSK